MVCCIAFKNRLKFSKTKILSGLRKEKERNDVNNKKSNFVKSLTKFGYKINESEG